jgi:hypothetical protein
MESLFPELFRPDVLLVFVTLWVVASVGFFILIYIKESRENRSLWWYLKVIGISVVVGLAANLFGYIWKN